MRLKRVEKKPGFSSGKILFKSDLFTVTIWTSKDWVRTTIKSSLSYGKELHFDYERQFITDALCAEQYLGKEIIALILENKQASFVEGGNAKIKDILEILEIG